MKGLPAMEQIQEPIVESIKEGPQERVQQRTVEQNVRAPVPTVQEQRFVSEIPRAQVVKRIQGKVVETIPQDRLQQSTLEHNMRLPVPTVQESNSGSCRIQNSRPFHRAQVVEQIQDHIVESIDQDLLDELRHEWLMGAFEPGNDEDEDGRRERKPSRMETVNRDEIKTSWFPVMLSLIAVPRLLDSWKRSREVHLIYENLLHEKLARRALVILSPWSQDFGRKLIGGKTKAKKQNKTKQNKTKQNKTKQSKAKQSKAKQSKAKQSKAKQSKAKQSKAKQSKAKQSKAKPHHSFEWKNLIWKNKKLWKDNFIFDQNPLHLSTKTPL